MTLVATKKRNRLFPDLWEDFFNEPFFNGTTLPSVFNGNVSLVPDANIIENPENYQIEIAAPGLEKKDFKVEVQNGILTISAEKEEEKKEKGKNFRRREFSFNSFSRSFSLPESLDADAIKAKYDNGVLKLTLPKTEAGPAEPAKQINVG